MRNKTLVAHHRALMPRAAHPPACPALIITTVIAFSHTYESKTGRPGARARAVPGPCGAQYARVLLL